MRMRLLMMLAAIPALAGWGERKPAWPYAGAMPDEPVGVGIDRYDSVAAGTRSYRPVEPMPWGDANSRVAPPQKAKPEPSPETHEGH